MSSNPVAPNERPSKRYAWVILNQTISPAFERLVARLCDELGPGLLLTGSDFARSSGQLEVRHGPAYDRRNLRRRLASWARFALWASAECARLKGAPFLLAATNPPLLPQVALFFRKLRRFPYGVLVWDIYPEHLVHIGVCREGSFVTQALTRASALALEGAEFVVTLSDSMAATLKRQTRGTPLRSLEVIPNWADTNALRPLHKQDNPLAWELGQRDKLTVLYSGNMGAGHTLSGVIEAAALLESDPRVEFLFIGDGLSRPALEAEVAQRKLKNVRFFDYQPHDRLPLSLALGDVAIVAQAPGTEHLSLPSKTYSSLAVGSAILALTSPQSDLGKFVTEQRVGAVHRADDGTAIAATVQNLADAPDELDELRTRARELAVESYSEDAVYTAWRALLAPLVSPP
ncbi:MAG: hypothetical protein B6A08_00855 [Sorangiineae bacterium NIC37A_2]|nr:MAG: hypothetical protein B6A08_00855 [Sorangiineae bacterium NIC37A_2]